jgi:hypothetical protein
MTKMIEIFNENCLGALSIKNELLQETKKRDAKKLYEIYSFLAKDYKESVR